MTKRFESWVESANNSTTGFPLNNLPYGVFDDGKGARCGVAIGDQILDLDRVPLGSLNPALFSAASWNAFMEAGKNTWQDFRAELLAILSADAPAHPEWLVRQSAAQLLMPFRVSEFTDFYADRHHATNVGTMFRGAENALPPNWLHMPIGYNGRASGIVVSGTPVRRPKGQLKGPNDRVPRFGPSRRFDFELELGAIVGKASEGPVSVDEADSNIFGYVLLNDWSARDIQAWEYQPLGPFQAKATATTVSPWIVTQAALAPFRVNCPPREFALLPYLKDTGPMLFDIDLKVDIVTGDGRTATTLTRTNYRGMYYSPAQQLAHHTSSGCPMRVGDLLGSGTVSGPEKPQRGSMLELSLNGTEPVRLATGESRSFIQDGDEIRISGKSVGNGYTIGFGECNGKLNA